VEQLHQSVSPRSASVRQSGRQTSWTGTRDRISGTYVALDSFLQCQFVFSHKVNSNIKFNLEIVPLTRNKLNCHQTRLDSIRMHLWACGPCTLERKWTNLEGDYEKSVLIVISSLTQSHSFKFDSKTYKRKQVTLSRRSYSLSTCWELSEKCWQTDFAVRRDTSRFNDPASESSGLHGWSFLHLYHLSYTHWLHNSTWIINSNKPNLNT